MRPPTIYLAGPINGCDDDQANDWRGWFMLRLPHCGYLNPMDRDYRGREDESVNEIVELDKEDIFNADVIIANCWQQSWGTAMELMYAWQLQRRIGVVVPEGTRVSPWLRYHSNVVVPTLEEAAVWVEAGQ